MSGPSMSATTGLFQHFPEVRNRWKGVIHYGKKGCCGLTEIWICASREHK